jgi:hypothetical protein
VTVEIREEPLESLGAHGKIPIAFRVDRLLDVSIDGPGLDGITLRETPVEVPYVKDYDAIAGEGPTRWPRQFDTRNWGLIAAYENSRRV